MSTIFHDRLKRLQAIIKEKKCDAFVIDDVTNIFYLTGCEVSAGRLLATKRGAKFFVDGRYFESCRKSSPFPVVLVKEDAFQKALGRGVGVLGFDSETTSFSQYTSLKKEVKGRGIKLKPLNNPVKELRSIKDRAEAALLREAAKLGSAGFDFVCSSIREGITELELAAELEIFWKRKGSRGLAFEPIIAFGKNSAIPHYKSGKVKLKKGDAILIDIGVNDRCYNSDMTRVLFFGKPKEKLKEAYRIVLEAQQAALEMCRPGMPLTDLDKAARQLIEKNGYGKEFCHSLGHGVGLEIHESPRIPIYNKARTKECLEEGMVVTIEPGIYLPGTGGIRIEDTVLITKDGHENLTNRPKEMRIIR